MKNKIRILIAFSCLINLTTHFSVAQVIPHHKVDTIVLVELSTKLKNNRPVSSYIIIKNAQCINELFCGSVFSKDSLKQNAILLFEPYLGFMQMFKFDSSLNYKDQKDLLSGLKMMNKKMRFRKSIMDEDGLLVSISFTPLIADFWIINNTSKDSSYISDSYLLMEELDSKFFYKLRKIIKVPSACHVPNCR
jgi:hypothetical protein